MHPAKTRISLDISLVLQLKNELEHDKTNKITSAPSKDTSAWAFAGQMPRLTCLRSPLGEATHKAHSEDSDQTGRMPRLI